MVAMGLEDLRVFQMAEKLADEVWVQAEKWEWFAKDTVGKQLVRAVDSVGANIAEAFGRFHYGEKLRFLYYARGSLYETKYWLNRAKARQLMPVDTIQNLIEQVTQLAVQINNFINSTKKQKHNSQTIREVPPIYETENDLSDDDHIAWLTD